MSQPIHTSRIPAQNWPVSIPCALSGPPSQALEHQHQPFAPASCNWPCVLPVGLARLWVKPQGTLLATHFPHPFLCPLFCNYYTPPGDRHWNRTTPNHWCWQNGTPGLAWLPALQGGDLELLQKNVKNILEYMGPVPGKKMRTHTSNMTSNCRRFSDTSVIYPGTSGEAFLIWGRILKLVRVLISRRAFVGLTHSLPCAGGEGRGTVIEAGHFPS